jgi:hypothetical protein
MRKCGRVRDDCAGGLTLAIHISSVRVPNRLTRHYGTSTSLVTTTTFPILTARHFQLILVLNSWQRGNKLPTKSNYLYDLTDRL